MTIDSDNLHELEVLIADRIFLQVQNWHLYLGDAGLSETLAIECSAYLDQGAGMAARKALESIQVPIGGGSTRLPLARLMPPGQLYDLEEILDNYCK